MSRTESQNKRLLKYLIQGHSISPRRADDLFGITRLAARVKDLLYAGIEIEKKMEYHGPVKFCRYWIPKDTVKKYQRKHGTQ